jgi:hypothetical protein
MPSWDVAPVRDDEPMGLSSTERLKVWVRAGGICAICKGYLLESSLTAREVTRGELAHNVGRKPSVRSPRSTHALPEGERDSADNVVLLCRNCHGEIDDLLQADLFDVDKVFAIKRNHEAFIKDITGRSESQRTVVLRLRGHVRGAPDDLGRDAATKAILGSTDRFPAFPFAPDRFGIEIDLRGIPGEADADPAYYQSAARRIDEVIQRSLKPAAEDNAVPHLSVFALARLPLLVYLGSRLDDTIATDVYQRHRNGETWTWPSNGKSAEFVYRFERSGSAVPTEGVLIVNASGTIHPMELPVGLSDLPRFLIEPVDAVPHVDTITTRETLGSFERAVRLLLGELEATHKAVLRLHLFAAAPISAAVTLGRAAGWGIHPSLAVYDRTSSRYQLVLEVTAP